LEIRTWLFIMVFMITLLIGQGVVYATDETIRGRACSIRYWDSPTWLPEGVRYIWNLESRFIANRRTCGRVGTVVGRHIRQSYIKLYETKDGEETGRYHERYSESAPNRFHATEIRTHRAMRDTIPGIGVVTELHWEWFYF